MNATILSALYLGAAAVVELVRRTFNPHWADRMSLALEAFPARTLHLFGLFEPLRQAWLDQRIDSFEVRLVYGLTTVAIIFTIGLLVGFIMSTLTRLATRPR